ncbi:dehydrogenase E1 component-domain-containing protein [Podospora didyma]|uniref:Pyruvate dehydrogenase E1 component subunit alpha n=1 Tax=Podospora didyma TaxID=330526 RepID=A0AAE0KDN7_9PEZI|nr:dehydrogenase E1 component-domain-containing protein [Podospora didyma]
MAGYSRPSSFSDHRKRSSFGDELTLHTHAGKMSQQRPRGPPTPSMSTPAADFDQQLTGSPPPPPTPAASPGPSHARPNWSNAEESEEVYLSELRQHFVKCSSPQRQRLLADLFNLCTSQQLSFVHQFVSPLLKKDPFTSLPDELCLRILSFIDDPKVLARASQVSRRWRDLLSDDMTWKNLCVKHDYQRRLSEVQPSVQLPPIRDLFSLTNKDGAPTSRTFPGALPPTLLGSGPLEVDGGAKIPPVNPRPRLRSYKSHFKQRYLVDAAWRTGGRNISRNITQDGGVVTSLHLTNKYIIVALDNAKIHVFDTEGNAQRTLSGHVMGVWAMVPWDDILVSGGCDRDVRVWDLTTGVCLHTLRGHTSTVRCLKMSDANTAISGSRDTTLRVWDIKTGLCRNVLVGHQASVRCLEIKGDIVVSGSYDTTAKVWSISEGRCIHTLQGHYSQIYAIAFDGNRVATGSLDTSVRIWNAATGECQAVLQGHTSLVGQLQMRGGTLVTGGSDGSVRVWSLERFCPIHRLAAHDNSVTSLQFDDTRVVSGGSDGRVKVWDLKTGHLVRELITQGEAVWRVAFEEEKCVAMALKNSRTVMEVFSFSPPEEVLYERPLSLPQRAIDAPVPERPLSAFSLDYGTSSSVMQDVEMMDAGPSTAPLQRSSSPFFPDGGFQLRTARKPQPPPNRPSTIITMFSRAARLARAVPARAAAPRAPIPSLVVRRSVTTNAASAQVDKSSVPQSDEEPFQVTLSDESFETYELDPPPYTMEVTKKELKQMYYDMVVIRQMEMAADRLYKEKKIRGFCHLSTGQEAVAVGIEHAINKTDDLITAYRCHGYAYMRGATVRSIIGELLGRREGIAYGKGGSMHMFTKGFYGGNGIVGAQVPVGAGLAFAQKYMDTKRATVILYGDGASNQGQVFEAFNMAKLWKLPALFGCENNKYGMGTSAARSSALTDYYKRGQYIPGLKVNGMDVLAVKAAVKYGKEWTEGDNGPMVLEYVTYRYGGHSMSDPGTTYRTREEIQRMRSTNDPIAGLKQHILDWGVAQEDELKGLDKEARSHVNEEVAIAEAMAVPEATPKILFEDIYVPGSEPQFIRGRTLDENFYFN